MMGNLAGQEAVWTAPDATLHIFFQFNDRGRGPKTTSVLKVGPDGIPVSEVITGNDYLKSPVNENYSVDLPRLRFWPTPLSRTAARSRCSPKARLAFSV